MITLYLETTPISLCCDADAYDNGEYECSKCHKACEVKEVCLYCRGTGECSVDETDANGNVERGVGTEKCWCLNG